VIRPSTRTLVSGTIFIRAAYGTDSL